MLLRLPDGRWLDSQVVTGIEVLCVRFSGGDVGEARVLLRTARGEQSTVVFATEDEAQTWADGFARSINEAHSS